MNTIFLTKEEVIDLTGYKFKSKQIEWAKSNRIKHYISKDGHPKITRSLFNNINDRRTAPEPNLSNIRNTRPR